MIGKIVWLAAASLMRMGWVFAAIASLAAAFVGYELVLFAATAMLPTDPSVFVSSATPVGSIVRPSEVSLLLLVPTFQGPNSNQNVRKIAYVIRPRNAR